MTVYILAGGVGEKIWPFGECRNKAELPVANVPVVRLTADAAFAAGADRVVVAGWHMMGGIKNLFLGDGRVTVAEIPQTRGSAETLSRAAAVCPPEGRFCVLFGDCLYDPRDIARLLAAEKAAALVSEKSNEPDGGDWITVRTADGFVSGLSGHAQCPVYSVIEGFTAEEDFLAFADAAKEFFDEVQVGAMPPHEAFVELALLDYARRKAPVPAIRAEGYFVDMDKPWLVMEANYIRTMALTEALEADELGEGASVDASAVISGHVRLGKNSRIGRNCTINGNIWVGDNTVIDNGAIIDGNVVVGNGTIIENFCYINGGSVIGNSCKVLHAAEFEGVLMDGAYLYHYMEIEGLIGKRVDIGASCVCGTLRFDEKNAHHKVRGRTEVPRSFANGVFIGDYSRTGVNCTFYPGVYIGCNSAVGPGVVVTENIPSGQRVLLKQELVSSPWGPEKYGW
ncbi:MAG: NTP transferase domain-containing protein [Clostridiales bacterium]|nr:NTP transferase domain-containing protein [Clostridiales bacterium]